LIAKADELEAEAENIELGSAEHNELSAQYYQMDQQLLLTRRNIAKSVQKPEYVLKFLDKPGRMGWRGVDVVEKFVWIVARIIHLVSNQP
jgi:hypothetical protein